MKTKYILHGGSAQHTNFENDKFFSEILKDTPEVVTILLVHFAGSSERAELNREIDTAQFERNKGIKKLDFEIAIEDKFIEQIKKADVIYFGGGTTIQLLESLQKFPDLRDSLTGKIVAGESAGANVFTTYCFSKSGGVILKCLGILPIKIIPHYEEKYSEYKNQLESVANDLVLLTLSNYQFKVIEV